MIEEITNKICQGLANKFDELFIEGLKRKGFEFESIDNAYDFINKRVMKSYDTELKADIYFVDNIPFFLHKQEAIYSPVLEHENEIKITATFGEYKFL